MRFANKPRGFSVKLHLVDGNPEGTWRVTVTGWSGVAHWIPRTEYPSILERDGFDTPGLYVLSGVAEDEETPAVYVGEADSVRERLPAHERTKTFWNRVAVFTTSDGSLHKAHVQHLESRLVDIARKSGRAKVQNAQTPALPLLSHADVDDAEHFLDTMLLVFPLLGIHAFATPVAKQARNNARFSLRIKEVVAYGEEVANGWLVLAGARLVPASAPNAPLYVLRTREKLLESGHLAMKDGALVLTKDFVFRSPSGAAATLVGYAINGREEWRDADNRSLNDREDGGI